MYLTNKYTCWYNNIIARAQNRVLDCYTEKHHIIPRSLGGSNSKTNLVNLTAREHFICHLLLTKMTTGNDNYKMIYSLHMLSNVKKIGKGRYTPSSRLYEYSRKLFIQSLDNIWTPEKRIEQSKKISNIMKTALSKLTPFEKSERMKKSCSAPETWTDERRSKISKALTGKVVSEETRNKMSISKQNRTDEQKQKCGDSNRGKTWKVINGKRVWLEKGD